MSSNVIEVSLNCDTDKHARNPFNTVKCHAFMSTKPCDKGNEVCL